MAAQGQSPADSASSSENAADQPITSPLHRSHVHQSFISPEVRFSGGITLPPSRPPNAWNPKYVTPVYLDERGPFEQPPVERDEWQRTGRRADAGVRRFSAYLSYCQRDGPRLQEGLHPSRSALRSLPSNPVRTLAASGLEGRYGVEQPLTLGCAADSLECRPHGHLTITDQHGNSRPVRGAFYPDRRPFSGLRHVVAPNASHVMESDARWQGAAGATGSILTFGSAESWRHADRPVGTPIEEAEALMEHIVTEFVPSVRPVGAAPK